jgi:protein-S-isoprenylcysteine O-methyltransferase Ste14
MINEILPSRWRDLIERAALAGLMLAFCARVNNGVTSGIESPIAYFVLVGEALILGFTMFNRRATDRSSTLRDWFLGFAGTAAPLFANVGGAAALPIALIAPLCVIALSLQIAAKLNLNRSFGIIPANRGVVTTGFYAVVRHPIYASYVLGHIAFLLLNPTLWNAGVYVLGLALQVMRMSAEERLLGNDPAYRAYLRRVRYRLAPGIY